MGGSRPGHTLAASALLHTRACRGLGPAACLRLRSGLRAGFRADLSGGLGRRPPVAGRLARDEACLACGLRGQHTALGQARPGPRLRRLPLRRPRHPSTRPTGFRHLDPLLRRHLGLPDLARDPPCAAGPHRRPRGRLALPCRTFNQPGNLPSRLSPGRWHSRNRRPPPGGLFMNLGLRAEQRRVGRPTLGRRHLHRTADLGRRRCQG